MVEEETLVYLLSDPSPCLRYRVLTELCGFPADHPEVLELAETRESDPLIPKYAEPTESISLQTAISRLRCLGYLGFDRFHQSVKVLAEHVFSFQRNDGSWPLPGLADEHEDKEGTEGYSMVPLQTALPLVGLSACGYSADNRSGKGYRWLLSKQLPDGSWPTGSSSGVNGRVAGYRKLSHSRWGCRSNTTAALMSLAWHSEHRRAAGPRRGLDLLLGRGKQEAGNIGFEVSRGIGAEPTRGFFTYFAREDAGLVLEICRRFAISIEDRRVYRIRDFILSQRNGAGLWIYSRRNQVSRWITFFLLRSIYGPVDEDSWIGSEPETAFQEYPKTPRRW